MSERQVVGLALGALATVILLPVAAVWWMTAVPGRSFTGPLPPATNAERDSAKRMAADVVTIASAPHNIRHPAALEAAARSIERSLTRSGYAVHRQVFPARGVTVRNIDVVIDAASPSAPTLVIGAHYDSFSNSPGANDNGTGTAAVLELARRLASLRGKANVKIRLVFFVNEEPPYFQTGQMGSLVYAKAIRSTGERVVGMVSLETLGYYSDRAGSQHYPSPLDLLYPTKGDFVAFVGSLSSRPMVRKSVAIFRAHAAFPSQGGTAPAFVSGIDWSDHWSFEQVGIPAVMITDTAVFRYPRYHRTSDRPDKVDYDKLSRVVGGVEAIARNWRDD